MALAKLKAVFTKKKSAANRNPGTDGPAPSATGEHAIQSSQNITGTADSARSTGAPEARGRVEQAREGGDVGPAPANGRFPRLRAAMKKLRLLLRRKKGTKGKQTETKAGDRPSGEARARDSLSIRTVPRGNTPPSTEEEHSLEGESMRVLDGHSVYEERVINPGFSVLRAKDKYGRFLRIN